MILAFNPSAHTNKQSLHLVKINFKCVWFLFQL